MKYVILDFGNVLVRPTTGKWFLTPKFYELIDIDKIDMNLVNENMKSACHELNGVMITLEEENVCITKFYNKLLAGTGYEDIASLLANDFTYGSTKYELYSTVKEELDLLSKKFKLLILSDNWPCGDRLIEEYGLSKYFDKVYISSYYDELKKDGLFFDRIIRDYKIKTGDACFVDDNIEILDVAKSKGLVTYQMDRSSIFTSSNHILINNLFDLYTSIK